MTAPNCTVDSDHHPIVLSVLAHIKVKAQCVPALSPVKNQTKRTKEKHRRPTKYKREFYMAGGGVAMKKWPKCCSYNKTQTEKNTYCHVFDIHVSLSLQLGNYLPVEPLKLQVRRVGEKGGDQRDENTCK